MGAGVLFPTFLAILLTLSAAVHAEVCFWSGSCSNKWLGGCGTGRIVVDQSDDCNGLCPQPRYPACLPFFTHLQCCNEETPTPSDECAQCPNRIEVGNHWMCCSDCSDATVTSYEAQTGFCRTGARLSIQPKAREVLRWITREWSVCSKRCGVGVRERSVRCVGSLEYSPQQLYYVNDTKCDQSRMPSRQENCNTRRCRGGNTPRGISLHKKEEQDEPLNEHLREHHKGEHHSRHKKRRKGMPLWGIVVVYISVVTVAAVGGLALGTYVLYKRRENGNNGFYYVTLGSYH
ncbi:hypothetical protein R1flu_001179 [Riccia fluitans]|uniref:Uncharacterized protein n=1 Tax=Riccia fluitans TaxID=41844 RepID=A0ABD1Y6J9_9MARC